MFGSAKFGWLKMLKNSARNCIVHAFRDHRVFHQCEIDVGESRAGNDIAARISEGERRVEGESRGVEKLRHGMRTGVRIAAHIGAIVAEAGAALIRARQHRKRLAGLSGDDAADLPSAAETIRNRRHKLFMLGKL